MSRQNLQMVFALPALTAIQVLDRCVSVLGAERASFPLKALDDETTIEALRAQLEGGSVSPLDLEWDDLSIEFAPLPSANISFVLVRSGAKEGWDKWVSAFGDVVGFLSGRVEDDEYGFWQNVTDPASYARVDRDTSGLRLKPNGLPPPLAMQIVDISLNPGRYCVRRGFIEAVGATMWLGKDFWNATGADKAQAMREPWIRASEDSFGILKIEVGDGPFLTAEGECGEQQRVLRSLLFPTSLQG